MKKSVVLGGEYTQESTGARTIRQTGGKDRHSKVFTSKGPRDRRVRLSVSTAIQFYDLQDRLGFDQPSKAVEWLLHNAQSAIDSLPELGHLDLLLQQHLERTGPPRSGSGSGGVHHQDAAAATFCVAATANKQPRAAAAAELQHEWAWWTPPTPHLALITRSAVAPAPTTSFGRGCCNAHANYNAAAPADPYIYISDEDMASKSSDHDELDDGTNFNNSSAHRRETSSLGGGMDSPVSDERCQYYFQPPCSYTSDLPHIIAAIDNSTPRPSFISQERPRPRPTSSSIIDTSISNTTEAPQYSCFSGFQVN